jgi:hypothetical protein
MRFEWDKNKNVENQKKHRVSFEDARAAFYDSNRLIEADTGHSGDEERWYCYGKLSSGLIVTVRFTMRGNAIRIIGAGHWRKGAQKYESRRERGN